MGQCKVAVELDRLQHGGGPIPCGELVRGVVVVEVDEEVEAQCVTIELVWTVRGKGNPVTQPCARETLPGVRLVPGTPARMPFEIRVPMDAPASYRGQLFELGWLVRVRVDLPWTLDVPTDLELAVVPGTRTRIHRDQRPTIAPNIERNATGLFLLLLLPMAAFGSLIVGLAFNDRGPVAFLWGFVLCLGGPLGFYLLMKRLLQTTSSARVAATLALIPERVAPGGEVEVRLVGPESLIAQVASASCLLLCEEAAELREDKRNFKFRHTLHEAEIPLSTPTPGAAAYLGCLARLPENAAPTLVVPSNRVQWRAVVRADIGGGVKRTWEQELEVDLVRPGAG